MPLSHQFAGEYRTQKQAEQVGRNFPGSYTELHGVKWWLFRPREGAPQQGVCADWDGEAGKPEKKPKKEPKPRAIRRENLTDGD